MKIRRPISTVIFDLDGTLVDSLPDISGSVNFALEKTGMPKKSLMEVRSFIGDGVVALFQKMTGKTDENAIRSTVDIFESHYLEHCADQTILYPGAREILRDLKDRKLALISNKPYEMVIKILKTLSIFYYFRIILGGESTKERKPHPEPVLKTLETLQSSPQEALIVGDGTTDIEAGKSAGVLTCAATYGYRDRAELEKLEPDYIIDRLSDLKDIVLGNGTCR